MRIQYLCGNRIFYAVPISLLLLLLSSSSQSYAQSTAPRSNKISAASDTIRLAATKIKDSAAKLADTLLQKGLGGIKAIANQTIDQAKSFKQLPKKATSALKAILPDSLKNVLPENPFRKLINPKPFFKFSDGQISYQFNYRSNIDTPLLEREISQHQVQSSANVMLLGILPLQVNFWSRQTNSAFYRDVTDVQLVFNTNAFSNKMQAVVKNRLLQQVASFTDSLSEKLYDLKNTQLLQTGEWLSNGLQMQKVVEFYELLHVPKITYDYNLSDSANKVREDSIKKIASAFIDLYNQTKGRYAHLKNEVDSLKTLYDEYKKSLQAIQNMINGQFGDVSKLKNIQKVMREKGIGEVNIPDRYKWLMGIRNFSLGRSNLNYSDLTASNLSLKGINFEYNSWYYVAAAAGTIDFRFREYFINPTQKIPQHYYIVRLGVGRIEKNNVIISAFKGRKQLFNGTSTSFRNASIPVSGISVASRYQVKPGTFISAEIAQSLTPDFRTITVTTSEKTTVSDREHQAYTFRLSSYLPAINFRLDGFYRYTGANFQSFSNFQSNSAIESWQVKAEQTFFKKTVRFNLSVKKNEYSNPYIIQNYKSNTVFKQLTVSFRKKRLPVVTMGYQPMSQLTMMGDQLYENRFQTLHSSIHHFYKIRKIRAATTGIVNKFYNNSSDSGFIYFNATNVYLSQILYFKKFTASVTVSHTKNDKYQLTVFDESVQLNAIKWGTIGFGVKINKMSQATVRVGGHLNASVRIRKLDMLSVSLERGYLPGFYNGLIKTDIGNIMFVKTLKF